MSNVLDSRTAVVTASGSAVGRGPALGVVGRDAPVAAAAIESVSRTATVDRLADGGEAAPVVEVDGTSGNGGTA